MSGISGKEKITLSERPIVGSKMQEPHQIILSGFSLQREVLEERRALSLSETGSDNFSPMPCTAGRSLPGWGPVERFSTQIFCNKVRYGDCARGSGPRGN